MDKFSILQKRARKALEEYEKFRVNLNVKEPMLSETIRREAQPFLKGYFTLAVVGEMSSGKSTFINALLGQRGLLPTAYGQTTCVLTEIIYSDTESIEVTFADGKIKNMDSKNLKNLVAIPSEFENIPVNEVNRLIISGLTFNKIRQRKAFLSQLQSGIEIDESLLKKYCSSHSKSNIPVKVVVKCILPEAYKGWRIVDTPGVGAIGGIEEATKDFINSKNENGYNNVDAIIFVNSGRLQLQRSGFNRFVEDTFDTIYEEARRRMFLIITFAADPNFIAHEEEEIDRAKNLFINKYKLQEDHLVCVDSICSLFLEYVKGLGLDLKALKKKNVPNDWSIEDWEAAINARNVFKGMLDEDEKEVNNENLLKYFDEFSGINELREKLNDFAELEKMKVFQSLMDHIKRDITTQKKILKKNETTISQKLLLEKEEFKKKVSIEKDKLEKLKSQKDSELQKIRTRYSKKKVSDNFSDMDSQILNLRKEDEFYKVDNQAGRLVDIINKKKSDIFDALSSDFESAYYLLQDKQEVTMPTIDFKTILKRVKKANTKKEIIGYEQKETSGFWGGAKRFLGRVFGKSNWGYENDYTKPIYGKDIPDDNKALKDYKDRVIEAFNSNLKEFISSISKRIELVGTEVSRAIDLKVSDQQKQYDQVLAEDNTSVLESKRKRIIHNLDIIEKTIKTIDNI